MSALPQLPSSVYADPTRYVRQVAKRVLVADILTLDEIGASPTEPHAYRPPQVFDDGAPFGTASVNKVYVLD